MRTARMSAGGVWSLGVGMVLGEYSPGGGMVPGELWSRGSYGPGGAMVPMVWPYPPPPTEWWTPGENITFPQLRNKIKIGWRGPIVQHAWLPPNKEFH